MSLDEMKCVPCRGGVPILTDAEEMDLLFRLEFSNPSLSIL